MNPRDLRSGVPVAPSMDAALHTVVPPPPAGEDWRRAVIVAGLAVLVALAAGLAARVLTALIGLITNLAFYGRLDPSFASPAGSRLGWLVIVVPVVGGVIVGLMARYGSAAIRGHGIPEAMEQVLLYDSVVPARVTWLKPLSAAISIGTGGPFGAEGPIIATGAALGSLIGQLLRVAADERKVLLAAGAAAGMAATFGTPVSAVLLAIELLLFEYRPRSLIPVAFAAATATAVRRAFLGAAPMFPMGTTAAPGGRALVAYVLLGAVLGVAAHAITRTLYAIEDGFARSRLHWMWWPAIGAVAVGFVGVIAPHTLGVGYDNIQAILGGSLVGRALLGLVLWKLVSWIVALGSGTSGGTLAPLFTIGGGAGVLLGTVLAAARPGWGLDPRLAGLVGMAALFAGASHALLASVIFAVEVTHQTAGLVPLLGGCTAAYLAARMMSPTSIMTEKLVRRGTRVSVDYVADVLDQVCVRDIATPDPVSLNVSQAVEDVRDWVAARTPGSTHQGFPVIDAAGCLVGVVTRRDLLDLDLPITARVGDLIRRPAVVVFDDMSVRQAADRMVQAGVGRLPVVRRDAPQHLVAIISRSDVLEATHRSRPHHDATRPAPEGVRAEA
jgi:chloride channel protein, CIC family